ncbi:MAG: type II toxin-antitoxin system HicA family toxin [Deltaproteobacteria bacterium]|nr:type II toxin-antitoxin system HicA family toxin [Deltaproteobacteria bacterium]MDL1961143.1 type II toxin-antitoxin system HicA family toxin [Deltaproteobacteria bacterium]
MSRKYLIKKFRNLGFNGPYSGGRNQFMIKENLKIRIPNPHKSGDITDSLLHEILRQAEISKDEWNEA